MLDPRTSSRLGKIRQADTEPELIVRSIIRCMGHRYRVRNRDLPGSPDIANRARRWAILVHGCFWHRHRDCSRTTTPRRNRSFWIEKFAMNRRRDCRVLKALRERDFKVLVVWECETKGDAAVALARRLRKFLA